MLFPVLWMLETALKDDQGHLRRPGQGDHRFEPDARPLQGRLQLGLAGVQGLQELGHRRELRRRSSRRVLGVPAAWAYSRFKIPAKKDQLFFILSTRFMPPVVVVIPVFLMFRDLNLLDTRLRA